MRKLLKRIWNMFLPILHAPLRWSLASTCQSGRTVSIFESWGKNNEYYRNNSNALQICSKHNICYISKRHLLLRCSSQTSIPQWLNRLCGMLWERPRRQVWIHLAGFHTILTKDYRYSFFVFTGINMWISLICKMLSLIKKYCVMWNTDALGYRSSRAPTQHDSIINYLTQHTFHDLFDKCC